jgi:3-oxoacyl-[acyl-carrier protein] reductase
MQVFDEQNQPVVLVTGGTRGIGLGLVQHLLSNGYRVATCGRGQEGPQLLAGESISSARWLYYPCDLAQQGGPRRLVAKVLEHFGRIDALVNNAAVAFEGVLAIADEDRIAMMLDINLRGTILVTKECVRGMLAQNSGSIIQIASIIADRGFSGLSAYAATKAGLLGFTKSLARELGPRNIRVNAVAPGYVETEMSESLSESQRRQIERRTPLGRLGQVEDIVPVIEFLISPASRFITGQTIVVDGGSSV